MRDELGLIIESEIERIRESGIQVEVSQISDIDSLRMKIRNTQDKEEKKEIGRTLNELGLLESLFKLRNNANIQ